MKKNLLFALIFFTFLFSCKKEEKTAPAQQNLGGSGPTTYYYLDTSITSFKFKEGTYWVYENDSTLALDSVIIDSVYIDFHPPHPGGAGPNTSYTEYREMYFQHFGTMQYYNQGMSGTFIYRNMTGTFPSLFGQPVFSPNKAIGFSSNGMTIEAKFSSFNIGTATFMQVDKVKITAIDQYVPVYLFDTHLYFCDSVGLIKKETEISPGNIESWSLKRWNIIR